jgi:hypothetical protein
MRLIAPRAPPNFALQQLTAPVNLQWNPIAASEAAPAAFSEPTEFEVGFALKEPSEGPSPDPLFDDWSL